MKNRIIKTELIEWKKAEWFQPDEFKKTSKEKLNKLKTSLKNNGFASPFYVYEKQNKTIILDGTRRDLALKELENEGVNIPDKLPATFLDIKTKKEAKKFLLIYHAEYGDINQDFAFDFFSDLNFDHLNNEIVIPSLNLELFKNPDFEPDKIENQGKLDKLEKVIYECPKCGNKFER
jgi:hypothetical protein